MKKLFLLIFLFPFVFLYSQDKKISLSYAIENALLNSIQLETQKLEALNSNYSYKLSLLSFLPTLSISYNDSNQVNIYNSDNASMQLSFSALQKLYDGGKSHLEKKFLYNKQIIENTKFLVQQNQIKTNTTKLFYDLSLAIQKQQLQNELLQLTKESNKISHKEFELGYITEIELIECDLQLTQQEIEFENSKQNLENMIYEFSTITGISLTNDIILESKLKTDFIPKDLSLSSKEYYNYALLNNIDIKLQKNSLQESIEKFNLSKLNFLPTISLEFGTTFSTDKFPFNKNSFSCKLNIEFPFDYFPLSGSINLNNSNNTSYSKSKSVDTNSTNNFDFIISDKILIKKLELAKQELNQKEKELEYNILCLVNQHSIKKSTIILLKNNIISNKKKLNILKTQTEYGLEKQMKYLEELISFYNLELSLLDEILSLIIIEEKLASLLNLDSYQDLLNLERNS